MSNYPVSPAVSSQDFSDQNIRNFLKKIDKNGPPHVTQPELGCCHPYKGALTAKGYGRISVMFHGVRTVLLAHRVAHAILIGPVALNERVLHSCDVRNCCNPAHLFKGDDNINMRDMALKGRRARKLTNEGVAELRALKGTDTITALAEKFGISRVHCHRVLNGDRRQHVAGGPKALPLQNYHIT